MKEYIDIIRTYLSDMINNHKPQGQWKIHSGNIITDHKTQGEWKVHLIMAILQRILNKFVPCIQKVVI